MSASLLVIMGFLLFVGAFYLIPALFFIVVFGIQAAKLFVLYHVAKGAYYASKKNQPLMKRSFRYAGVTLLVLVVIYLLPQLRAEKREAILSQIAQERSVKPLPSTIEFYQNYELEDALDALGSGAFQRVFLVKGWYKISASFPKELAGEKQAELIDQSQRYNDARTAVLQLELQDSPTCVQNLNQWIAMRKSPVNPPGDARDLRDAEQRAQAGKQYERFQQYQTDQRKLERVLRTCVVEKPTSESRASLAQNDALIYLFGKASRLGKQKATSTDRSANAIEIRARHRGEEFRVAYWEPRLDAAGGRASGSLLMTASQAVWHHRSPFASVLQTSAPNLLLEVVEANR